jgi:hypothetical protein
MIEKRKNKPGAGRPSGYKPGYCEDIIAFFRRPYTKDETRRFLRRGKWVDEQVTIPEEMPDFWEYADKIRVTRKTLNNWKDKYPEFKEAWERCRALQKRFINYLGANNLWDPHYAQFMAVNITDMRGPDNRKIVINENNTTVQRTINMPAKKPEGSPVG